MESTWASSDVQLHITNKCEGWTIPRGTALLSGSLHLPGPYRQSLLRLSLGFREDLVEATCSFSPASQPALETRMKGCILSFFITPAAIPRAWKKQSRWWALKPHAGQASREDTSTVLGLHGYLRSQQLTSSVGVSKTPDWQQSTKLVVENRKGVAARCLLTEQRDTCFLLAPSLCHSDTDFPSHSLCHLVKWP